MGEAPSLVTTDVPIGRRAWWVVDEHTDDRGVLADEEYGVALRSTVVNYTWPGPVCMNEDPPAENPWKGVNETKAKNHKWRGQQGERADRWGFYSFRLDKDKDHLLRYMFQISSHKTAIKCIGHVALLGTVWEHDLGYRSQGVRVERLALFRSVDLTIPEERIARIVERLENRYRCEAEVFNDSRIGNHD